MITYKTPEQIAKMRAAGRLVAATLRRVSETIAPGRTPRQLNDLAERLIREAGGTPSFLGYRDYPAATCIAVNAIVVHGIPNDTALREGDVLGLDFGVILDGWHADGAWTFPVGTIDAKAQRLLNVTRESLMQGVAKARVGNRVGDVSHAIQRYVESNGYHIVRDLVGHGIGRTVHEPPNVPNFGKPRTGPPLRKGMTFCIEPMVNMGTAKVRTLDDGWTVVAADGKLSAHFEHTVAVNDSGPEILTQE